MSAYQRFAELYDRLTFDVDYEAIAARIDGIFEREEKKPHLVLDLACGTGTLTRLLAQKGYDMIGVDASDAMLQKAQEKCPSSLLLLQNMQEFELYGTVDAIVCMLDSVNYLTEDSDLDHVFHLANNYLNPNGLFIFDINSEYKFRNILANHTYTYETDDIFYVWENDFDEETKLCDFYLTFFEQAEDGRYTRFDEMHTERMYTCAEIEKALERHGFTVLAKCDGYTKRLPEEKSERILYVCRNTKPIQQGF
ncbi:MAG: methyltransferase domain-containing protein [Clostridia bacterium]|nr:methyltransferase domain-containing protein [Clostridia bacterium]